MPARKSIFSSFFAQSAKLWKIVLSKRSIAPLTQPVPSRAQTGALAPANQAPSSLSPTSLVESAATAANPQSVATPQRASEPTTGALATTTTLPMVDPQTDAASSLPRQNLPKANPNPSTQASEQLEKYLLALKLNNCSPATIRNYKSDIKQFCDFTGKDNLQIILTKPKLQAFIESQQAKGLAPATIKRKLISIAQFSLWAKRGKLLGDPDMPSGLSQASEQQLFDLIEYQHVPITKPLSKNGRPQADIVLPVAASTAPFGKIGLVVPYINLALIALFAVGLGYFGYQQFTQADPALAFPTTLTRPQRVLSFQGRLLDQADTPIVTGTQMRFRLFDNVTGGTQLWDSNTCTIDPDVDGIFTTNLGGGAGGGADTEECGAEIGDSVFTENSNVWLQVTIGAETLSPRQPIQTVAYALNAETLQGFPASASAVENTVLVMNNAGEVVLGNATPAIVSTGDSFTLEGEALTIQTPPTSNTDISLLAGKDVVIDAGIAGVGGALISKDFLAAPGATLSATYAGGSALTLKAGPTPTADILRWQTEAGTNLGVIAADGDTGLGTDQPEQKLTVSDNIQLGVSDGTRYVYFDNGTANNSGLRYNAATDKLQFSHDGTTWSDLIDTTGVVTSVSNADGSLTISPTTGAVVASLNVGNANTWTGLQTFNNTYTDFAQYLRHEGDADTYMQFTPDVIGLTAGGKNVLTLDVLAGQDLVTVGDGTDMDTRILTDSSTVGLFVEGSSGRVGVGGVTAPAAALEVGGSGTIRVGGLTASLPVKTNANKDLVSGAIDLASAEVTGVLPIANGGTNSTATPTNGGVAYGDGSAYAFTGAGTSGYVLRSNGASAPTWDDPNSLISSYWSRSAQGVVYPTTLNDVVAATSSATTVLTATQENSSLLAARFGGTTDSTSVVVDGQGRLGVGITNPGSALEVGGVARINQSIWLPRTSSSPTTGLGGVIYSDQNGLGGADTTVIGGETIQLRNHTDSSTFLTVNSTGNLGIGDTSPAALFTVGSGDLFQVNSSGAIAAATGITSSGNITFTGLAAGTSDSVVTENSGLLEKRTIDSRVWGSTLVDGSGTTNYVTYWSDANTLTAEQYLATSRGGLGGDVTAAGAGELLYSTGTTTYDSLASGTSGYVLQSNGAAAPSWVSAGTLFTNYWTRSAQGVVSPSTLNDVVAATSSATTVLTATQQNSSLLAARLGGSTDTTVTVVDGQGNLAVGTTTTTGARFNVRAAGSEDLARFTDSSGNLRASITNDGFLDLSDTDLPATFNLVLRINDAVTGIAEVGGCPTCLGNGFIRVGPSGRSLANFITDSTANSLFSGGVENENYRRFAILGNGDFSIGSGTAAWDTNLGRNTNGGIKISTTLTSAPTLMLKETTSQTADLFQVQSAAGSTGDYFVVDGAGSVGVGDATPANTFVVGPNSEFQVNSSGAIAAATGITSSGNITFTGLAAGATDTVITQTAGNVLEKRTIDSRVWGSSLVDGSGTTNYVTYWSDANTLAAEQYLATSRGGLGGNVTAAGAGELLYSTGTTTYDSLASGTSGYILQSTGAGAPNWVSASTVFTNHWTRSAQGIISPTVVNDGVAATSSATTVLTATQQNSSLLAARIGGTTDATSVVVTGDGELGIGTTNPQYKFQAHTTTTQSDLAITTDVNVGSANTTQLSFVSDFNGTAAYSSIGQFNTADLKISGVGNLVSPDITILAASGNVGIGDSSPTALFTVGSGDLFQVNSSGAIAAAAGITSSGTITFSGLGAGSTDTVVTQSAGNVLQTRTIDSRVWGSSLVDGSGTTNYVTYWSDANTLAAEQYLATSRGGLGGNVTAAGAGEILYSTSTTTYDSLASGTSGYILQSTGAGAPSWVSPSTVFTNHWTRSAQGVVSPTVLNDVVAATSSATTVLTATQQNTSLLAARIGGTTDATSLVVGGDGEVGIGTITPAGKFDVTDTSNTAASLTLTNNTATTIGAGVNTLGVVDLQSTSLTTGNLVNIEANALTTGRAFNLSSTSTAITSASLFNVTASGNPAASWTGNLGLFEYQTSTDVDVDGSALKVGITGAGGGDGVALNVTSAQTGANALALRVNDDGTYTDSTPFVITIAGDVGVGDPTPNSAFTVGSTSQFQVNSSGAIAAATGITSSGNISFTGLAGGTTDTVLIQSAGNVMQTRTIDSRVWGSSLVDGSGTTNYVTYWSDANTLAAEQYLATSRGGLGNTVTAAGAGEILYSTSTTAYDSLASGTSSYVLRSNGAAAPSWVDVNTLVTNYWTRSAQGIVSPSTLNDGVAATSSATTVLTATQQNTSLLAARIGGTTDATSLVVGGDGEVGIGTITPAGKFDVTDTSNTAASLTLTNNTATTIGAGVNTLGVVDLQSTSLTTGNLVNIEANALTTGRAFNLSSTSTAITSASLFNVTASGNPAASWTGNLGLFEYQTSTDVDVDGSALKVGITGAGGGVGVALNITSAQTGATSHVFRASDDGTYTDATPFVIRTSGDVGIGTDAPGYKLEVIGTTASTQFTSNNDGYLLSSGAGGSAWLGVGTTSNYVGTSSTNDFSVRTDATDRLYVLSTGEVGIANTDPTHKLTIASTADTENQLALRSNRSAIANTETIGGIEFISNDTSLTAPGTVTAMIEALATAAHTTTVLDTAIAFSTVNGTTMAEVMRINDDNRVGIGTTTPARKLHVLITTNAPPIRLQDTNGYCEINPTTTTWTCTSDARLKKEVLTLDPITTLDKVSQLNAVTFLWNKELAGSERHFGFIAQEVETIFPQLVNTDENGLKTVDYGAFTPILAAAIQTVNAQVDQNQVALSQLTTATQLQSQELVTLNSQLSTTTTQLQQLAANSLTLDVFGQLNLFVEPQSATAVIADQQGNPITQLAAFSQAMIGKLQAGLITTNQLTATDINTTNASVSGALTAQIITTQQTTTTDLATTNLTATGSTTLGALTAQTSQLGSLLAQDATISSSLTVSGQTALGALTASIAAIQSLETSNVTVTQTASIATGRIAYLEAKMAQLETVKAQTAELTVATISGMLYAQNIADFDQKVAATFGQPSLLANLLSTEPAAPEVALTSPIASQAGELRQSLAELNLTSTDVVLTPSALFIKDYFETNGNGYIAGSLGVGQAIVLGDGLVLTANSLSYQPSTLTADTTFAIQPSGKGKLALLGGIVTISEGGMVEVNGNLWVAGEIHAQDNINTNKDLTTKGTLASNTIRPLNSDEALQVKVSEQDEASGEVKRSRFEIVDELGTPVATISADGKAKFASLGVTSENITATGSGTLSSSQTAGRAKLTAGQTEITIKSELITTSNLIYVTPISSTSNQVLYVKAQTPEDPTTPVKEGEFRVGVDVPVGSDIEFNWWIVN